MDSFQKTGEREYSSNLCKRCGHELTKCPNCGSINIEIRWQDPEVLIKDLKQTLFKVERREKKDKTSNEVQIIRYLLRKELSHYVGPDEMIQEDSQMRQSDTHLSFTQEEQQRAVQKSNLENFGLSSNQYDSSEKPLDQLFNNMR